MSVDCEPARVGDRKAWIEGFDGERVCGADRVVCAAVVGARVDDQAVVQLVGHEQKVLARRERDSADAPDRAFADINVSVNHRELRGQARVGLIEPAQDVLAGAVVHVPDVLSDAAGPFGEDRSDAGEGRRVARTVVSEDRRLRGRREDQKRGADHADE